MNDDAGEEDPLRLARLAIFCSVFGAAILLGLVMSIVRQQPPVRLSQKNVIRIDLSVPRPNGAARPLLNLRVRTPTGFECDLPLESLVRGIDHAREWDKNNFEILQQHGFFYSSGLSFFGEVSPASANMADGSLMIENPAGGQWQFWLRWCGVADDSDPTGTIAANVRVTSNQRRGVAPMQLQLGFGQLKSLGAPVTITASN